MTFAEALDMLKASPTGKAHRRWLNERAARPPLLRSGATLLETLAHGKMTISTGGRGYYLAFHGPAEVIRALHNWSVNTGVISPSQRLHWYSRGLEGNVAYVCPRDIKAVKRGLCLQLSWEMVRDREVPVEVIRDDDGDFVCVRWDERRVNWLAMRRAIALFRDHVRTSGIILDREDGEPAEIYHLRSPGREGSGWGTGTEG